MVSYRCMMGNDRITPVADAAAKASGDGAGAPVAAARHPPLACGARNHQLRAIAGNPVVDNLRRAYTAVVAEPMPFSLADLVRQLE
jgi:hypothetical protein